METRPLTLEDFVTPLSEYYSCSAEEYKQFTDFTHVVTGIKDRQKVLASDDDPKKKKKR